MSVGNLECFSWVALYGVSLWEAHGGRYLSSVRSFSEEEGEGPSRRTNDSPPQHSSERFRPLNHGADCSAAVALIYCYVGRESVHALIVPTYTVCSQAVK